MPNRPTLRRASVLGVFLGSALLAGACDGGSRKYPLILSNNDSQPPTPVTSVDLFQCSQAAPPVTALVPPPPLSGGTLLYTRNGTIVASDPDRDCLWVVGFAAQRSQQAKPWVPAHTTRIDLASGDEPGRLVEDANGRVHVALRRGGAVVTVDVDAGKVVQRTPVCTTPRGLAYDGAAGLIHVACERGELVSLSADSGAVTRSLLLDDDLRDVVVDEGRLLVSRFRSAEVLVLDAAGTVAQRRTFPKYTPRTAPSQRFEPSVAWRMVGLPGGGAVVSHQRGFMGAVAIDDTPGGAPSYANGSNAGPPPSPPPGNNPPATPPSTPPEQTGCTGSPVETAVSVLRPGTSGTGEGATERHAAPPVPGTLPIDVAVSPDGSAFAVVAAGIGVSVSSPQAIEREAGTGACAPSDARTGAVAGAVAVAYAGADVLLVQSLEPAQITVVSVDGLTRKAVIVLPGESHADDSQAMFHTAPSGTLACASCHPEGREDGRVWRFSLNGQSFLRRTQLVSLGGLLGTAPCHWAGNLAGFPSLLDEVWVHRMGGPVVCPENGDALAGWLDKLPAPAPRRSPELASAAVRGSALFFDPNVGCSTCHSGPHYTNNQTVNVGTGDDQPSFQVPSLIGVGTRSPYIHNGCAVTLYDRFTNPCAGGDKHGHTSGLAEGQIQDLVSFLETL